MKRWLCGQEVSVRLENYLAQIRENMDNQWLKSNLAKKLKELEVEKLAACLPDLSGHYLLQYSAFNEMVVKSSTLKHHFLASEVPSLNGSSQLQMNYQQLPFRENCLDCVVAHHVLDFNASPHQCLREAARTVVPNGYLVIVGFNPWSAWGWSRLMPRTFMPAGGRHLSRRRVTDWLTLLGFRVEQSQSALFMPPFALRYFPDASKKLDAVLGDMGSPFGGVYILIARKLVAGRTPVRPQWRVLAGRRIPVVAPTTRGARVTNR